MELEVKHLAPYLPYGLKLQYVVREKVEKTGIMKSIIHNEDETHPTKVSIEWGDAEHIWMFKPILRPISDIAKVFETMEEDDKKVIMHCDYLLKEDFVFWQEPYFIIQILFKYHFDVFGLIEKGLAVSIHDVV